MAQSFQAHIEELARNGLATHWVANPPSVDSVFAVARVQDLPEVRFAAAFEDGSLVLGCPDGLPDLLKDLAQVIEVPPMPEPTPAEEHAVAPAADLSALDHKLDALLARAEAMPPDDALARIEAGQRHLAEQLSALPQMDESRAQLPGTDLSPVMDALASLQNQLNAAPMADPGAEIRPADPVDIVRGLFFEFQENLLGEVGRRIGATPDTLEALRNSIDAIQQRLDTPPEPSSGAGDPALAGIPDQLAALADQLAALTRANVSDAPDDLAGLAERMAALETLPDLTRGIRDGIARLYSALGAPSKAPDLTESLAPLAAQISALAERPLPEAPDLGPLETRLDAILASLAPRPDEGAVTGIEVDLSEVMAALDGISAALSSPAAPNLAGLELRLDDLAGRLQDLAPPDFGEVMGGLERISAEIAELTPVETASPADDLARDGILAKLGRLAERVDAVATEIEAGQVVAGIADLAARLDVVHAHPDLSGIEAGQAALLDQLAPLAGIESKMQALAAQIAALAKRSDGGDAAETGQALAQLRGTLDRGLAKIDEALAAQDQKADLTDLRRSLEQALSTLADLPRLAEQTARIETLLAEGERAAPDLMAGVSAALAEATAPLAQLEDLAGLLSRIESGLVPPVVDLTPQRQGFARFETVLSAALRRLEAVPEAVSQALNQNDTPAHSDVAVISAIEAAHAELSGLLTETRTELAGLRVEIGSLSRQPAPQLDLTPQRQSLARFGTALGAMLERFDGIAGRLEDQRRARPTSANVQEPPIKEGPVDATDGVQGSGYDGGGEPEVNGTDDGSELAGLEGTGSDDVDAGDTDEARPEPLLAETDVMEDFDLDGIEADLSSDAPETGPLTTEPDAHELIDSPVEASGAEIETADPGEPAVDTKPEVETGAGADPTFELSPFAMDDRVSLRDLRHSFAEMIATQIRDTTLARVRTNRSTRPEDV